MESLASFLADMDEPAHGETEPEYPDKASCSSFKLVKLVHFDSTGSSNIEHLGSNTGESNTMSGCRLN
jgi:hypothetical protein